MAPESCQLKPPGSQYEGTTEGTTVETYLPPSDQTTESKKHGRQSSPTSGETETTLKRPDGKGDSVTEGRAPTGEASAPEWAGSGGTCSWAQVMTVLPAGAAYMLLPHSEEKRRPSRSWGSGAGLLLQRGTHRGLVSSRIFLATGVKTSNGSCLK